jgi:hypothetical protein
MGGHKAPNTRAFGLLFGRRSQRYCGSFSTRLLPLKVT